MNFVWLDFFLSVLINTVGCVKGRECGLYKAQITYPKGFLSVQSM